MSIWTATVMLYLILDPVGITPLLITLLKDTPVQRRSWVIFRESLFALGVLVFFLFLGRPLLTLLDIHGPELEIAGGIVIFLISLRMIFPVRGGLMGEEEFGGEPFLVPLAVPLLAGPSAIAIVMLFTSTKTNSIGLLAALVAVLLAWFACLLTMLAGHQLARILGRRGVVATERLMGMVLCVIAIHIMFTGLERYFTIKAIPPASAFRFDAGRAPRHATLSTARGNLSCRGRQDLPRQTDRERNRRSRVSMPPGSGAGSRAAGGRAEVRWVSQEGMSGNHVSDAASPQVAAWPGMSHNQVLTFSRRDPHGTEDLVLVEGWCTLGCSRR